MKNDHDCRFVRTWSTSATGLSAARAKRVLEEGYALYTWRGNQDLDGAWLCSTCQYDAYGPGARYLGLLGAILAARRHGPPAAVRAWELTDEGCLQSPRFRNTSFRCRCPVLQGVQVCMRAAPGKGGFCAGAPGRLA